MCRYHIDPSELPIICIIDPRTGLKVRDYDGNTIKAADLATICKQTEPSAHTDRAASRSR